MSSHLKAVSTLGKHNKMQESENKYSDLNSKNLNSD